MTPESPAPAAPLDPAMPTIEKASTILGHTLTFRNAGLTDAEFIINLRTDSRRSEHISETSSDLHAQQQWLQRYSTDKTQAYFIIEHGHKAIGSVRLYDAKETSFCWGSWILQPGAPAHAAIESSLIVYQYACDQLGFTASHFEVRKANERVWKFHERFGAIRTHETPDAYEYAIALPAIQKSVAKYSRYLPDGISVFPMT